VSLVVVAGELPSAYARRARSLPFDSRVVETTSKLAAFLRSRVHYVTNTVEKVRLGSTVEKDYDVPAPPGVRTIGWLDDLSLRHLTGEVAVMLAEPKDLNDLALLMHVNKRVIFHVDFDPNADAGFILHAALLLLNHPRVRLRDPAFSFIAHRPVPPVEHVILYGYEVVRGYEYRAFLVRGPVRVRYSVLGTSYVATGYFTPENDPFIRYLTFVTGTRPPVVVLDEAPLPRAQNPEIAGGEEAEVEGA
jgi:hypothetical protein